MTPNEGLRIGVLGMTGRCPFGGQTLLYLNWLRGFHKAGHEVWYVEDDSVWPYDPLQNTITDDCKYAVRHIADCLARIGLQDRWAFRLADRKDACWGLSEQQLKEIYPGCDVIINLGGRTPPPRAHTAAP